MRAAFLALCLLLAACSREEVTRPPMDAAATRPPSVAVKPASEDRPVADPWARERASTNENGAYPVPEFLREADLRAPPGSPHIDGERAASGVAYRRARQALVSQGFIPVRVLSQDAGSRACGGTAATCDAFPEVLQCTAGGMEHCAFLYRREATGRYWIVSTIGEEGVAPDVDFERLRCCGYRPARPTDLDNAVIAGAGGKPFRFRYPPAPLSEDEAPLCSETKGGLDCWVKPPPGYRTSQAQASVKPSVRRNTPYPDARRQLIAQGLDPVVILKWDVDTGRCEDSAVLEICRNYSEVMNCAGAGGPSPCEFLYRDRKSGLYWRVLTDGLPLVVGGSMRQIRFSSVEPVQPGLLNGLTVRLTTGRPFTFKSSERR